MSLLDQGEGRTVSLIFHVKLSPPVPGPVGRTTMAASIAYELRMAGEKLLLKICEGQGYSVDIDSTSLVC